MNNLSRSLPSDSDSYSIFAQDISLDVNPFLGVIHGTTTLSISPNQPISTISLASHHSLEILNISIASIPATWTRTDGHLSFSSHPHAQTDASAVNSDSTTPSIAQPALPSTSPSDPTSSPTAKPRNKVAEFGVDSITPLAVYNLARKHPEFLASYTYSHHGLEHSRSLEHITSIMTEEQDSATSGHLIVTIPDQIQALIFASLQEKMQRVNSLQHQDKSEKSDISSISPDILDASSASPYPPEHPSDPYFVDKFTFQVFIAYRLSRSNEGITIVSPRFHHDQLVHQFLTSNTPLIQPIDTSSNNPAQNTTQNSTQQTAPFFITPSLPSNSHATQSHNTHNLHLPTLPPSEANPNRILHHIQHLLYNTQPTPALLSASYSLLSNLSDTILPSISTHSALTSSAYHWVPCAPQISSRQQITLKIAVPAQFTVLSSIPHHRSFILPQDERQLAQFRQLSTQLGLYYETWTDRNIHVFDRISPQSLSTFGLSIGLYSQQRLSLPNQFGAAKPSNYELNGVENGLDRVAQSSSLSSSILSTIRQEELEHNTKKGQFVKYDSNIVHFVSHLTYFAWSQLYFRQFITNCITYYIFHTIAQHLTNLQHNRVEKILIKSANLEHDKRKQHITALKLQLSSIMYWLLQQSYPIPSAKLISTIHQTQVQQHDKLISSLYLNPEFITFLRSSTGNNINHNSQTTHTTTSSQSQSRFPLSSPPSPTTAHNQHNLLNFQHVNQLIFASHMSRSPLLPQIAILHNATNPTTAQSTTLSDLQLLSLFHHYPPHLKHHTPFTYSLFIQHSLHSIPLILSSNLQQISKPTRSASETVQIVLTSSITAQTVPAASLLLINPTILCGPHHVEQTLYLHGILSNAVAHAWLFNDLLINHQTDTWLINGLIGLFSHLYLSQSLGKSESEYRKLVAQTLSYKQRDLFETEIETRFEDTFDPFMYYTSKDRSRMVLPSIDTTVTRNDLLATSKAKHTVRHIGQDARLTAARRSFNYPVDDSRVFQPKQEQTAHHLYYSLSDSYQDYGMENGLFADSLGGSDLLNIIWDANRFLEHTKTPVDLYHGLSLAQMLEGLVQVVPLSLGLIKQYRFDNAFSMHFQSFFTSLKQLPLNYQQLIKTFAYCFHPLPPKIDTTSPPPLTLSTSSASLSHFASELHTIPSESPLTDPTQSATTAIESNGLNSPQRRAYRVQSYLKALSQLFYITSQPSAVRLVEKGHFTIGQGFLFIPVEIDDPVESAISLEFRHQAFQLRYFPEEIEKDLIAQQIKTLEAEDRKKHEQRLAEMRERGESDLKGDDNSNIVNKDDKKDDNVSSAISTTTTTTTTTTSTTTASASGPLSPVPIATQPTTDGIGATKKLNLFAKRPSLLTSASFHNIASSSNLTSPVVVAAAAAATTTTTTSTNTIATSSDPGLTIVPPSTSSTSPLSPKSPDLIPATAPTPTTPATPLANPTTDLISLPNDLPPLPVPTVTDLTASPATAASAQSQTSTTSPPPQSNAISTTSTPTTMNDNNSSSSTTQQQQPIPSDPTPPASIQSDVGSSAVEINGSGAGNNTMNDADSAQSLNMTATAATSPTSISPILPTDPRINLHPSLPTTAQLIHQSEKFDLVKRATKNHLLKLFNHNDRTDATTKSKHKKISSYPISTVTLNKQPANHNSSLRYSRSIIPFPSSHYHNLESHSTLTASNAMYSSAFNLDIKAGAVFLSLSQALGSNGLRLLLNTIFSQHSYSNLLMQLQQVVSQFHNHNHNHLLTSSTTSQNLPSAQPQMQLYLGLGYHDFMTKKVNLLTSTNFRSYLSEIANDQNLLLTLYQQQVEVDSTPVVLAVVKAVKKYSTISVEFFNLLSYRHQVNFYHAPFPIITWFTIADSYYTAIQSRLIDAVSHLIDIEDRLEKNVPKTKATVTISPLQQYALQMFGQYVEIRKKDLQIGLTGLPQTNNLQQHAIKLNWMRHHIATLALLEWKRMIESPRILQFHRWAFLVMVLERGSTGRSQTYHSIRFNSQSNVQTINLEGQGAGMSLAGGKRSTNAVGNTSLPLVLQNIENRQLHVNSYASTNVTTNALVSRAKMVKLQLLGSLLAQQPGGTPAAHSTGPSPQNGQQIAPTGGAGTDFLSRRNPMPFDSLSISNRFSAFSQGFNSASRSNLTTFGQNLLNLENSLKNSDRLDDASSLSLSGPQNPQLFHALEKLLESLAFDGIFDEFGANLPVFGPDSAAPVAEPPNNSTATLIGGKPLKSRLYDGTFARFCDFEGESPFIPPPTYPLLYNIPQPAKLPSLNQQSNSNTSSSSTNNNNLPEHLPVTFIAPSSYLIRDKQNAVWDVLTTYIDSSSISLRPLFTQFQTDFIRILNLLDSKSVQIQLYALTQLKICDKWVLLDNPILYPPTSVTAMEEDAKAIQNSLLDTIPVQTMTDQSVAVGKVKKGKKGQTGEEIAAADDLGDFKARKEHLRMLEGHFVTLSNLKRDFQVKTMSHHAFKYYDYVDGVLPHLQNLQLSPLFPRFGFNTDRSTLGQIPITVRSLSLREVVAQHYRMYFWRIRCAAIHALISQIELVPPHFQLTSSLFAKSLHSSAVLNIGKTGAMKLVNELFTNAVFTMVKQSSPSPPSTSHDDISANLLGDAAFPQVPQQSTVLSATQWADWILGANFDLLFMHGFKPTGSIILETVLQSGRTADVVNNQYYRDHLKHQQQTKYSTPFNPSLLSAPTHLLTSQYQRDLQAFFKQLAHNNTIGFSISKLTPAFPSLSFFNQAYPKSYNYTGSYHSIGSVLPSSPFHYNSTDSFNHLHHSSSPISALPSAQDQLVFLKLWKFKLIDLIATANEVPVQNTSPYVPLNQLPNNYLQCHSIIQNIVSTPNNTLYQPHDVIPVVMQNLSFVKSHLVTDPFLGNFRSDPLFELQYEPFHLLQDVTATGHANRVSINNLDAAKIAQIMAQNGYYPESHPLCNGFNDYILTPQELLDLEPSLPKVVIRTKSGVDLCGDSNFLWLLYYITSKTMGRKNHSQTLPFYVLLMVIWEIEEQLARAEDIGLPAQGLSSGYVTLQTNHPSGMNHGNQHSARHHNAQQPQSSQSSSSSSSSSLSPASKLFLLTQAAHNLIHSIPSTSPAFQPVAAKQGQSSHHAVGAMSTRIQHSFSELERYLIVLYQLRDSLRKTWKLKVLQYRRQQLELVHDFFLQKSILIPKHVIPYTIFGSFSPQLSQSSNSSAGTLSLSSRRPFQPIIPTNNVYGDEFSDVYGAQAANPSQSQSNLSAFDSSMNDDLAPGRGYSKKKMQQIQAAKLQVNWTSPYSELLSTVQKNLADSASQLHQQPRQSINNGSLDPNLPPGMQDPQAEEPVQSQYELAQLSVNKNQRVIADLLAKLPDPFSSKYPRLTASPGIPDLFLSYDNAVKKHHKSVKGFNQQPNELSSKRLHSLPLQLTTTPVAYNGYYGVNHDPVLDQLDLEIYATMTHPLLGVYLASRSNSTLPSPNPFCTASNTATANSSAYNIHITPTSTITEPSTSTLSSQSTSLTAIISPRDQIPLDLPFDALVALSYWTWEVKQGVGLSIQPLPIDIPQPTPLEDTIIIPANPTIDDLERFNARLDREMEKANKVARNISNMNEDIDTSPDNDMNDLATTEGRKSHSKHNKDSENYFDSITQVTNEDLIKLGFKSPLNIDTMETNVLKSMLLVLSDFVVDHYDIDNNGNWSFQVGPATDTTKTGLIDFKSHPSTHVLPQQDSRTVAYLGGAARSDEPSIASNTFNPGFHPNSPLPFLPSSVTKSTKLTSKGRFYGNGITPIEFITVLLTLLIQSTHDLRLIETLSIYTVPTSTKQTTNATIATMVSLSSTITQPTLKGLDKSSSTKPQVFAANDLSRDDAAFDAAKYLDKTCVGLSLDPSLVADFQISPPPALKQPGHGSPQTAKQSREIANTNINTLSNPFHLEAIKLSMYQSMTSWQCRLIECLGRVTISYTQPLLSKYILLILHLLLLKDHYHPSYQNLISVACIQAIQCQYSKGAQYTFNQLVEETINFPDITQLHHSFSQSAALPSSNSPFSHQFQPKSSSLLSLATPGSSQTIYTSKKLVTLFSNLTLPLFVTPSNPIKVRMIAFQSVVLRWIEVAFESFICALPPWVRLQYASTNYTLLDPKLTHLCLEYQLTSSNRPKMGFAGPLQWFGNENHEENDAFTSRQGQTKTKKTTPTRSNDSATAASSSLNTAQKGHFSENFVDFYTKTPVSARSIKTDTVGGGSVFGTLFHRTLTQPFTTKLLVARVRSHFAHHEVPLEFSKVTKAMVERANRDQNFTTNVNYNSSFRNEITNDNPDRLFYNPDDVELDHDDACSQTAPRQCISTYHNPIYSAKDVLLNPHYKYILHPTADLEPWLYIKQLMTKNSSHFSQRMSQQAQRMANADRFLDKQQNPAHSYRIHDMSSVCETHDWMSYVVNGRYDYDQAVWHQYKPFHISNPNYSVFNHVESPWENIAFAFSQRNRVPGVWGPRILASAQQEHPSRPSFGLNLDPAPSRAPSLLNDSSFGSPQLQLHLFRTNPVHTLSTILPSFSTSSHTTHILPPNSHNPLLPTESPTTSIAHSYNDDSDNQWLLVHKDNMKVIAPRAYDYHSDLYIPRDISHNDRNKPKSLAVAPLTNHPIVALQNQLSAVSDENNDSVLIFDQKLINNITSLPIGPTPTPSQLSTAPFNPQQRRSSPQIHHHHHHHHHPQQHNDSTVSTATEKNNWLQTTPFTPLKDLPSPSRYAFVELIRIILNERSPQMRTLYLQTIANMFVSTAALRPHLLQPFQFGPGYFLNIIAQNIYSNMRDSGLGIYSSKQRENYRKDNVVLLGENETGIRSAVETFLSLISLQYNAATRFVKYCVQCETKATLESMANALNPQIPHQSSLYNPTAQQFSKPGAKTNFTTKSLNGEKKQGGGLLSEFHRTNKEDSCLDLSLQSASGHLCLVLCINPKSDNIQVYNSDQLYHLYKEQEYDNAMKTKLAEEKAKREALQTMKQLPNSENTSTGSQNVIVNKHGHVTSEMNKPGAKHWFLTQHHNASLIHNPVHILPHRYGLNEGLVDITTRLIVESSHLTDHATYCANNNQNYQNFQTFTSAYQPTSAYTYLDHLDQNFLYRSQYPPIPPNLPRLQSSNNQHDNNGPQSTNRQPSAQTDKFEIYRKHFRHHNTNRHLIGPRGNPDDTAKSDRNMDDKAQSSSSPSTTSRQAPVTPFDIPHAFKYQNIFKQHSWQTPVPITSPLSQSGLSFVKFIVNTFGELYKVLRLQYDRLIKEYSTTSAGHRFADHVKNSADRTFYIKQRLYEGSDYKLLNNIETTMAGKLKMEVGVGGFLYTCLFRPFTVLIFIDDEENDDNAVQSPVQPPNAGIAQQSMPIAQTSALSSKLDHSTLSSTPSINSPHHAGNAQASIPISQLAMPQYSPYNPHSPEQLEKLHADAKKVKAKLESGTTTHPSSASGISKTETALPKSIADQQREKKISTVQIPRSSACINVYRGKLDFNCVMHALSLKSSVLPPHLFIEREIEQSRQQLLDSIRLRGDLIAAAKLQEERTKLQREKRERLEKEEAEKKKAVFVSTMPGSTVAASNIAKSTQQAEANQKAQIPAASNGSTASPAQLTQVGVKPSQTSSTPSASSVSTINTMSDDIDGKSSLPASTNDEEAANDDDDDDNDNDDEFELDFEDEDNEDGNEDDLATLPTPGVDHTGLNSELEDLQKLQQDLDANEEVEEESEVEIEFDEDDEAPAINETPGMADNTNEVELHFDDADSAITTMLDSIDESASQSNKSNPASTPNTTIALGQVTPQFLSPFDEAIPDSDLFGDGTSTQSAAQKATELFEDGSDFEDEDDEDNGDEGEDEDDFLAIILGESSSRSGNRSDNLSDYPRESGMNDHHHMQSRGDGSTNHHTMTMSDSTFQSTSPPSSFGRGGSRGPQRKGLRTLTKGQKGHSGHHTRQPLIPSDDEHGNPFGPSARYVQVWYHGHFGRPAMASRWVHDPEFLSILDSLPKPAVLREPKSDAAKSRQKFDIARQLQAWEQLETERKKSGFYDTHPEFLYIHTLLDSIVTQAKSMKDDWIQLNLPPIIDQPAPQSAQPTSSVSTAQPVPPASANADNTTSAQSLSTSAATATITPASMSYLSPQQNPFYARDSLYHPYEALLRRYQFSIDRPLQEQLSVINAQTQGRNTGTETVAKTGKADRQTVLQSEQRFKESQLALYSKHEACMVAFTSSPQLYSELEQLAPRHGVRLLWQSALFHMVSDNQFVMNTLWGMINGALPGAVLLENNMMNTLLDSYEDYLVKKDLKDAVDKSQVVKNVISTAQSASKSDPFGDELEYSTSTTQSSRLQTIASALSAESTTSKITPFFEQTGVPCAVSSFELIQTPYLSLPDPDTVTTINNVSFTDHITNVKDERKVQQIEETQRDIIFDQSHDLDPSANNGVLTMTKTTTTTTTKVVTTTTTTTVSESLRMKMDNTNSLTSPTNSHPNHPQAQSQPTQIGHNSINFPLFSSTINSLAIKTKERQYMADKNAFKLYSEEKKWCEEHGLTTNAEILAKLHSCAIHLVQHGVSLPGTPSTSLNTQTTPAGGNPNQSNAPASTTHKKKLQLKPQKSLASNTSQTGAAAGQNNTSGQTSLPSNILQPTLSTTPSLAQTSSLSGTSGSLTSSLLVPLATGASPNPAPNPLNPNNDPLLASLIASNPVLNAAHTSPPTNPLHPLQQFNQEGDLWFELNLFPQTTVDNAAKWALVTWYRALYNLSYPTTLPLPVSTPFLRMTLAVAQAGLDNIKLKGLPRTVFALQNSLFNASNANSATSAHQSIFTPSRVMSAPSLAGSFSIADQQTARTPNPISPFTGSGLNTNSSLSTPLTTRQFLPTQSLLPASSLNQTSSLIPSSTPSSTKVSAITQNIVFTSYDSKYYPSPLLNNPKKASLYHAMLNPSTSTQQNTFDKPNQLGLPQLPFESQLDLICPGTFSSSRILALHGEIYPTKPQSQPHQTSASSPQRIQNSFLSSLLPIPTPVSTYDYHLNQTVPLPDYMTISAELNYILHPELLISETSQNIINATIEHNSIRKNFYDDEIAKFIQLQSEKTNNTNGKSGYNDLPANKAAHKGLHGSHLLKSHDKHDHKHALPSTDNFKHSKQSITHLLHLMLPGAELLPFDKTTLGVRQRTIKRIAIDFYHATRKSLSIASDFKQPKAHSSASRKKDQANANAKNAQQANKDPNAEDENGDNDDEDAGYTSTRTISSLQLQGNNLLHGRNNVNSVHSSYSDSFHSHRTDVQRFNDELM